jgi:DNA recombination protein RmuC
VIEAWLTALRAADGVTVAAVAGALGLVVGLALGLKLAPVREHRVRRLARELFDASEDRHRMATEAMLERARAAFGELAFDALGRSGERLLDLADARLGAERGRQAGQLEEKKAAIDQELGHMGQELERVRQLVTGLERERARGLGQVSAQLEQAARSTAELARTTEGLREALRHGQRRGQWGERLAEDVLRQAGLVEGFSYERQRTLDGGGRPDFTFKLPHGRRVHMDVKFPLDNYLRFVEARDPGDRTRLERTFLNDVRAKVKELGGRDYGRGDDSVDYVLLFIPNEPLAGFIFERRPELVDEALEKKVVPCAPASLFAILCVIREAVETFTLAEAADELLAQMRRFRGEWGAFKDELARLGRKFDEAQNLFASLEGPRLRALERPLERLEGLRTGRAAPEPSTGGRGEKRGGEPPLDA